MQNKKLNWKGGKAGKRGRGEEGREEETFQVLPLLFLPLSVPLSLFLHSKKLSKYIYYE